MAGDWVSGKWTLFGSLLLIYCAPVSACITSLLDMAFNCNWFIKITRSFGSGFRKQQIAKPNVRLIIIENRSKQRFISDQIGNILVCVKLWLIVFFCYVCYHVNIFYVSGTIMGLTFLDPDTIVNFLFEIHTQIRDTYLACCRMSIGECWLLDFFHFSASWQSRDQYRALRSVSCHRCAELRIVLLSEVLKEVSQP
jgi:hypothetical protein